MDKIKSLFVLALILLFSSCEKVLIKPDTEAKDPVKNFNFLWNYVNTRYPYFEEKKQHYGLDWDKVYETYNTQVHEGMSDNALYEVLAKMLNELKDGHSNLISPFKVSFYDKQFLDTANFNWDLIVRNYLMKDPTMPTYNSRSGFVWTVLKDSIGYVRYGSFMSSIGLFPRIMREFEAAKVKGLIVDIRNNGGGIVENAQKMAGYFITDKMQVGYSKIRLKENTWSEPLRQYIEPQSYHWKTPVVLLTSKGSFSSANLFASYLKPLPNVTMLGDSSGGGGALPFDYELPNGWYFRISEVPFFNVKGESIEEGVAPEVAISQSKESFIKGKDDLIEAAIKILK